jgi:hypothetical protein
LIFFTGEDLMATTPASPPSIPASSPAQPARPQAAAGDDVAALLLSILRDVNRQAATGTPQLSINAAAAVANFRQIAESLRTLADAAPGT